MHNNITGVPVCNKTTSFKQSVATNKSAMLHPLQRLIDKENYIKI